MNAYRQKGAALLTSLLILLVLSLLAISSMRGAQLQEKMVAANRDSQIALEAAEFAARNAEELLVDDTVTLGNFGSQSGLYNVGNAPNVFADSTWDNSGSASVAATGFPGSELAEAPRYFIEYTGEIRKSNQANSLGVDNYAGSSGAGTPLGFRIVAWSSGRSGQTQRVLEVFYGAEK